MGKKEKQTHHRYRHHHHTLDNGQFETSPELNFVKSGLLNLILFRDKDKDNEVIKLSANTKEFLEDKRIIRHSNMDQVTFNKNCTFKFTLEFAEPMPCVVETAVRESTDWVLCTCHGSNAFYSNVEQRLVLAQSFVCVQSNVEQLLNPFTVVLLYEDDE